MSYAETSAMSLANGERKCLTTPLSWQEVESAAWRDLLRSRKSDSGLSFLSVLRVIRKSVQESNWVRTHSVAGSTDNFLWWCRTSP